MDFELTPDQRTLRDEIVPPDAARPIVDLLGSDDATLLELDAGHVGLVVGRAVHIWIDGTMHESKFFGAFGNELLPGTNRNLKVIATLAYRWGA